jgi:hypothetical protein
MVDDLEILRVRPRVVREQCELALDDWMRMGYFCTIRVLAGLLRYGVWRRLGVRREDIAGRETVSFRLIKNKIRVIHFERCAYLGYDEVAECEARQDLHEATNNVS